MIASRCYLHHTISRPYLVKHYSAIYDDVSCVFKIAHAATENVIRLIKLPCKTAQLFNDRRVPCLTKPVLVEGLISS